MGKVRIIDADSHVEESEEYWRYLDKRYETRRPFRSSPKTGRSSWA